jgi:metal-responsive CopG/Arc/MetJ family transcriptional regulator
MKTISLKLSDQLHDRVVRAAKDKKTTKSEILRIAVENYLAQRNGQKRLTMRDLIGDLAGCLKGGPPDLATNPRHMEGFGR